MELTSAQCLEGVPLIELVFEVVHHPVDEHLQLCVHGAAHVEGEAALIHVSEVKVVDDPSMSHEGALWVQLADPDDVIGFSALL